MTYLVSVASASEDTMNAFTGTRLIHTDTQFSVYLWDNPSEADMSTIHEKVQLFGMVSMYIPPQKEVTA